MKRYNTYGWENEDGDYVLFSDHEAALAASRLIQEGWADLLEASKAALAEATKDTAAEIRLRFLVETERDEATKRAETAERELSIQTALKLQTEEAYLADQRRAEALAPLVEKLRREVRRRAVRAPLDAGNGGYCDMCRKSWRWEDTDELDVEFPDAHEVGCLAAPVKP